MADVKLSIAGRTYDVHCADGEEQQLFRLAAMIDEKARSFGGGTEVRQLLFAALMLADEVQESGSGTTDAASEKLRGALTLAEEREAKANKKLEAARQEIGALRHALAEAASEKAYPAPNGNGRLHDRALLAIADRIETLATRIEQLP
ncbi:cell division protein ZapA [Sphingopyxis sp. MWB1]|uniref:cell division protein ZapA n=1 Tax=Sphingopyxis sp. MWB1 TaxID=1537715 RepID=UPI00051A1215|nr:cell division protein ZapA [Sphingopyxis sp. MWB1]